MRVLAVDFGEKRVGLAISDPLRITAQSLETFKRQKGADEIAHIRQICEERQVSECIVGLPLRLDGQTGAQAKIVLQWVDKLKIALKCPVKTWDERLTSKEASRLMIQQGLRRNEQKEKSDLLSAILILQNYLDNLRHQTLQETEHDEENQI